MSHRLAVSLTFFVNGAFFACIACRIPDLQRHLRLDDGQLGLALLSGAMGAFVGVTLTGRFCARVGSHRVAIGAGFVACLLLPLLALSEALWSFMSVFLCLGASTATMDIAMNTNGVAVENLQPKPIMSSLHGMFSLGTVAFAGLGWLLIRSGASVTSHFTGASCLFAVALCVISPKLLRTDGDRQITPPFALPKRAVLMVALIAFCAFLSEGAVGDWSAVYLRKSLHQTPATSTVGYFAFTLCMTATRFAGDSVVHFFGATATLRACGFITALGMGAALFLQIPALTIVGFASVGIGMATVAPIAFSAGGRLGKDNPDHAISSIGTLSYTAFLIGPALIGFIAKGASLRIALSVVVFLALMIVCLAPAADESPK